MGGPLKDPHAGPDAMFSTDLAPSRGQHETIARLAGDLLGFPLANRYDATVAIVRLRKAITERRPDPLPEEHGF